MSEPDRSRECGDAAAYVLGALDDHEARAFAAHIAGCSICRDEVASLKIAADLLPLAVTPVAAPPALRARLMEVVNREAQLLARSAAPAVDRPRRRPRLASFPFAGGAAASLTAAAVVGFAVLSSGGQTTRLIRATVTGSPGTAVLAEYGSRAELRVSHLRAAPAGRIYEVWVQRHGVAQPTDSLFNVTANGTASAAVPGSLTNAQAVMVTAEPLGGSRVPTSRPVVVASLQ